MFTGIIEHIGEVVKLEKEQDNLHISMRTPITSELKIDQSVAHNGVCLTVVETTADRYSVTAIQETLEKSNLEGIKMGDLINLERAMMMNSRLDGHIVQGHVDQIGFCTGVDFRDGSWFFDFEYDQNQKNINAGISLGVQLGKKLASDATTNKEFFKEYFFLLTIICIGIIMPSF